MKERNKGQLQNESERVCRYGQAFYRCPSNCQNQEASQVIPMVAKSTQNTPEQVFYKRSPYHVEFVSLNPHRPLRLVAVV